MHDWNHICNISNTADCWKSTLLTNTSDYNWCYEHISEYKPNLDLFTKQIQPVHIYLSNT